MGKEKKYMGDICKMAYGFFKLWGVCAFFFLKEKVKEDIPVVG